MMNKNSKIILIALGIILVLIGLYYFVLKKTGINVLPAPIAQSKTQILSRMTADLNRQSVSADINDIKEELDATDFSKLDEGVKR